MLNFRKYTASPQAVQRAQSECYMRSDGALPNLYKNAAFVAFMRGSFSPVVIQPR
jgi:hypothetical protein